MEHHPAIQRLLEAIRIPTISYDEEALRDYGPFLAFHQWLEQAYPLMHQRMERELVDGYALLYRWPGKDPAAAPAMFMAHMDVVPPGPDGDWRYPPFEGILEGGQIWGRGSLDMKGQLVAICEASEELLRQGFVPQRDIYLSFGYDEELMKEPSAAKAARLLQSRGIRFSLIVDEGIVPDLTPLGIQQNIIALCVAEKGYADIRLNVQGAAGHSSAPPPATALGGLARAIVAIEDNPMPRRLEGAGPTGALLSALAPLSPFGQDLPALFLNAPKLDALTHTTMAPTMAKGADMSNVLPKTASAVVNVRIAPWDTLEGVLTHLHTIAPQAQPEILLYNPPVAAADLQGAAYQHLLCCAREAFPQLPVLPYVMTAATDSRCFVNLCHNILRVTPFPGADAALMHAPDERIPAASFLEAISFFQLLIAKMKEL